MGYYLHSLKNTFNANGRANRKEYWMFILMNFMVLIVAAMVFSAFDVVAKANPVEEGMPESSPLQDLIFFIFIVYFMVTMLITKTTLIIRRLHDQCRSGWNFLWSFVPGVGPLIILVFACIEGTPGRNYYGDGPLYFD